MGLFDFFKKDNGDTDLYPGGLVVIPSTTINFGGPRYKFLFMPYNKLARLMLAQDFNNYMNEGYRYIRNVVNKWIVLKRNNRYLFVEKDNSIQETEEMKYFIDSAWANDRAVFRELMKGQFGVDINNYEMIEVSASNVLQILGRHGF